MNESSRLPAGLRVAVGIAGIVLWVAIAVVAWIVLPRVGHRAVDAVATAGEAVGGMGERLEAADATLGEVDASLESRLLEAAAQAAERVRDELDALRDIARGIDAILRAVNDLPLLDVGEAGADRAAPVGERVTAVIGLRLDDHALDLERAHVLVTEARERVGTWRASLTALEADLGRLEGRLRRATLVACLLVTLLALWSAAGQVCLVRRGREVGKRA